MKKQNGITLISLIITIIIMLILAGVSLSMVMGDGSMLDQANAAAANTRIAEVQEFVDLAAAGNKMAKYSKIGLKSKDALLAEMVDQGLITEAEKTAVASGADLEINGTKIEFTELETSYNDAVNAGATNSPVEGEIPNQYTVTFLSYTGTTLTQVVVEEGGTAVYSGTTPTRAQNGSNVYTFNGSWSTTKDGSAVSLTNITSDMTLYPLFNIETISTGGAPSPS